MILPFLDRNFGSAHQMKKSGVNREKQKQKVKKMNSIWKFITK